MFIQNYFTIIRIIELVSFLIANIIAYSIFLQFFPFINFFYLIGLFVISFVILKTNSVFSFPFFQKNEGDKESNKNSSDSNEVSSNKKGRWVRFKEKLKNINFRKSLKIIIVSFKFFFFNVFYELFPVYLIWISFLGLYYLVALYLFDSLNFSINESFYSFSATLGIILGVFQYYMKRNEEKVFSKITMNGKKISNIVSQETDFNSFFSSLEEDDNKEKSLKNWISNQIDPKLKLFDYLRAISNDKEISKEFRRIIRNSNRSPINIQITDVSSDRKYDIIENSVINTSHDDQLKRAYSNFFGSEEIIENIIRKIENEINLSEFGTLVLSNINIVNEVLPQLINNDLIKELDVLLCENPEYPKCNELDSSLYRQMIQIKVMKRIYDDIIL